MSFCFFYTLQNTVAVVEWVVFILFDHTSYMSASSILAKIINGNENRKGCVNFSFHYLYIKLHTNRIGSGRS